MPWTTPTLSEVRTLNRDNITARLRSGAMIPNSVLRVMSDANAGLAHLTLLYLDWLSKQFLPDTAETEWLDRHAAIWLTGGRKDATYAEGTATFTGVDGTILPAGTRLIGSDGQTNVEFETLAEITIGSTATPASIRAIDPGEIGNLDEDTILSMEIAISGIDGQATVIELAGGTDAESDTDLRTRVLLRIREPPMGGDKMDYVQWALAVPGVTRAWAYPNEMGIGTITVRFMMDDLRAAADGFPVPDDIDTVTDYLDTVRPVTTKDFFVVAPIPQPLSMTISGLDEDDAATRAAIEQSIRDMLEDKAEPGQTIYRSWVDEAVSRATGEEHHELTFTTATMASAGHMASLGTIIFTA